jgi:hypothetical protein
MITMDYKRLQLITSGYYLPLPLYLPFKGRGGGLGEPKAVRQFKLAVNKKIKPLTVFI